MNNDNFDNNGAQDYVIGEGFSIAEDDETDDELFSSLEKKPDSPKPKKKKKRNGRSWLFVASWISAIFIVSVVLAGGALYFASDYLGIRLKPNSEEKVKINIGMGLNTDEISEILADNGIINNAMLFKLFSKLKHYDANYKYGVYEFNYESSYKDIARRLTTEGAKAETVTVRIPEMASIDDIAKIMAENRICTEEEFLTAVQKSNFNYDFVKAIPVDKVHYRLEGYLFPDTYEFFNYGSITCAEAAIDRMLKQTAAMFDSEALATLNSAGRTVHDALTIASIVEMEASAAPAQMSKVAQVFYNRLVWDEPHYLGSSPTAKYPYGNGSYDTNNSNPNATEGMPPGPYCAPSKSAIQAAIYPETGFKMTYFVTDKDMEFYYNDNYNEHLNTIKRLKNQGKWAG